MAHQSRKKHIKHVQKHRVESDSSTAKTFPSGTKATAGGTSHKARLTSRATVAAKAVNARAGTVANRARIKDEGTAKAKKGLVRRIAKAATKKIVAKPHRALSRAKARVRSLLGRDKAAA